MILKQIGKQIQKQRKAKGFTQQKLAEMIDVSTNYISAVERGINQLGYDKLVALMNCLGCTADDIFADVIDNGYQLRASKLTEQLEQLSPEERNRILTVVEAMIQTANKK